MVNSFAVYLVDLEDQPMRRDRFGPLSRSRRSRLSPQQLGYVIPDDALVIRGGTMQLSDLRKNAQTTLETMSRLGVSAL
jgi:hypothetical protein